MIESIVQKISSYNIFNYLLPGVIYVALLEMITSYSLVQDDVIVGLFLYYFIGMVISRVGSLIIEPILKKSKTLKFAPYKDYIKASKSDKKIELLSEVNNTYRTFISLFLILLLTKLLECILQLVEISKNWVLMILFVALLTLFILSYRKQSDYINKRISSNLED